MALPVVTLARGREGAPRAGHPWVFSGAIASVTGSPTDGDEVVVRSADGGFVARGLFNGRSQIRVRLYVWEDRPLDEAFFASRIADAVRLRTEVLGRTGPGEARRLVFSEGDGLSGLTVDRYGAHLVVQLTSLALARRLEPLLDALDALVRPEGVVLRTERGIREQEGLELRDGMLRGTVPEGGVVEIVERELRFGVDLRTGQKTGFYLDQRENRALVTRFAEGRNVADVCCYSGGFSVSVAGTARSVVGIDSSEPALRLARDNATRNGVAESCRFERADAFDWLEAQVERGARYDMLILDPPRFARTRRGVPQALRAYETLNTRAIACLAPDAILVTCSCSGRVSEDDFAAAVARAAVRAGRRVQVLERRGQAPDHPVSTACPETRYLKCLVCRVL